MKHENPETKLIREQEQYIRILEEQPDVCREQIKALELLTGEQNRARRQDISENTLCLLSSPKEKEKDSPKILYFWAFQRVRGRKTKRE